MTSVKPSTWPQLVGAVARQRGKLPTFGATEGDAIAEYYARVSDELHRLEVPLGTIDREGFLKIAALSLLIADEWFPAEPGLFDESADAKT